MSEKTLHEGKRNFLVAYLQSAFEEFGKITWPTKEQAAFLTVIVVAVSFFVAVLIGVLDFGFSELYQLALDKFSSL